MRRSPATACPVLKTTILLVVASLLFAPIAPARGGILIPHEIDDMLLVGVHGPSKSTVTRHLLMVGDYLYCSGEPGMQTVDAGNPANLVLTDDWTASSAKMNGAAARGNMLYVTNWYPPEGLVVFDIGNPAHPARVRTLATTSYAWDAEIFGGLMYVTIGAETDAGISTYDIATVPENPSVINTFMLGDRLCNNVARYGNHMYFTHKEWLYVYNAANPANPTFVRTLWFNTLCGNVTVHNNHLYMLGRGDGVVPQREGGLWVFSLANPANPALIGRWSRLEPRDMYFWGDYCFVPASGSGVYTLNVSNPANTVELANWGVSWPGAGNHGGYSVCVAGTSSGNHIYIGTTSGNNPGCDDFTCSYYGARVYSVRIAVDPPVIAPMADHQARTGFEYRRLLTLTQADPPPTWSIVTGPSGLQVDGNGLVNGWTPGPELIGQSLTITVRASNRAGSDTESWQVRVRSRADLDGDDDVDQTDFGLFQACLSGAGQSPLPECLSADLEGDKDVDGHDFDLFITCLSGRDQPPGG